MDVNVFMYTITKLYKKLRFYRVSSYDVSLEHSLYSVIDRGGKI